MGSRGGGRPAANHRGHQRSDSDGDDNPRPARRARGSAARGTTRGRGSSRCVLCLGHAQSDRQVLTQEHFIIP